MRQRYPDEMAIILQHEFWDLAVGADGFEVSLNFSRKPERLTIPFDSITGFSDPSVPFGFKLEPRVRRRKAKPEPAAPKRRPRDAAGREGARAPLRRCRAKPASVPAAPRASGAGQAEGKGKGAGKARRGRSRRRSSRSTPSARNDSSLAMGDIVNLRVSASARRASEDARQAARSPQSRSASPKVEKQAAKARADLAERKLDAHKLEGKGPSPAMTTESQQAGGARTALVKRSIAIRGTSHQRLARRRVLAPIEALARQRAMSVSALIAEIDAARGEANLSSAIRVFVLECALQ